MVVSYFIKAHFKQDFLNFLNIFLKNILEYKLVYEKITKLSNINFFVINGQNYLIQEILLKMSPYKVLYDY